MWDEDFEPFVGRVGRDRRFAADLRRAANLARGAGRGLAARGGGFSGARMGRGAAIGGLLRTADRFAHARARRVIVKARIVRLCGKGAARALAHLRYLQRDGTTRDGERATLYDGSSDRADGALFQDRCAGDRHQFRFIVAPEDGAEYEDLKPLTRRLMAQVEHDLGTRLDWVAVDHFNTGQPHTHILLRGVDERERDLVIARSYITRGIRERATELVNNDLGPRSDREIEAVASREVGQERFTSIDRRLLRAMDEGRLVSSRHRDAFEQGQRAGRLALLTRMGLAEHAGPGLYRLDGELEPVLRAMGRRGDIIATMDQALRGQRALPQDYAIYDPAQARSFVGEVLARGLSDEQSDRRYLIIGGTDGRSHYVDLGLGGEGLDPEAKIVRIEPVIAAVRGVDRTIAEVAAASGGIYSIDDHLARDPEATHNFAQTHVRRLEALRRAGAGPVRDDAGRWTIGPDHLERVLAHEQRTAAASPVSVDVLAVRPVADLARHDGHTWLDEQCVADQPEVLGRGFGASVRAALAIRRQWLVEQELASTDGDTFRYRADMTKTLRERDLRRVALQLSQQLGLAYVPNADGRVEGIYRQSVQVGTTRYALIEDGKCFDLVPWRPVLERQLGKRVSGIDRGGSISWTFGRGRTGPEIE